AGERPAAAAHEWVIRGGAVLAMSYATERRERYERYFGIGRGFAGAVGKPTIMGLATRFRLPRPVVMSFALRVMGNLSDGRDGDAQDRLFYLLQRLARASS